MGTNMGQFDRAIRFGIAVLIAVLYATGTISGTLAIVLGIVALIFALTSLVSFCPLYKVVGINTCPRKKQA